MSNQTTGLKHCTVRDEFLCGSPPSHSTDSIISFCAPPALLHFNLELCEGRDSIFTSHKAGIMSKGKLDLKGKHFLCCRSY